MPEFILSILAVIRVFLRSRSDTALEVLALRQQVAVLKRKRPRPTLNCRDRLFWTTLRRCWSRWSEVLVIVKPETVVGWHRTGFRFYWRWRSRARGGRPRITDEVRVLIRRLAEENPDWGAPRIHGELQKLGLSVSERTVARYVRPPRTLAHTEYDFRLGFEIQCRCHRVLEGDRSGAQTDERPVTLAERHRGALGGKLPP